MVVPHHPNSSAVVLMVSGPDRPGIVEQLADLVANHKGNWEEARMTKLAGRFAGVVSVTVPPQHAQAMTEALLRTRDQGLTVVVESASPEQDAGEQVHLNLHLVGSDRPGILKDVTRLVAAHTVNVEEITTRRREAPMAGGMLFEATARLAISRDGSVEPLRAALEALSAELAVEIELR